MRQQKFYANTLTRFFTPYVWSWALPFTGLFCVFLCLLSSTKASAPTTTTYPYNYMYGTVAVCIAQNWTLTDWLTDWLIDWLCVVSHQQQVLRRPSQCLCRQRRTRTPLACSASWPTSLMSCRLYRPFVCQPISRLRQKGRWKSCSYIFTPHRVSVCCRQLLLYTCFDRSLASQADSMTLWTDLVDARFVCYFPRECR